MRVEVLYAPGCGRYRKAKDTLEMVIAEERLPLPVHTTESTVELSPQVILDGEPLTKHHCFDQYCLEELREEIQRRWHALTKTSR